MRIEIPGRETLHIETIVLDFNGTLANHGCVSEETRLLLTELAKGYPLFVLTADTLGNAAEECKDLPVVLWTFPGEDAGLCKARIVEELNPQRCACIGNGFNDVDMFAKAALTIGVLGAEGICTKLIQYSDIVVSSIEDGLRLFLDTKRLIATLRS